MVAPRTSILLPTRNRADVIGYAIRSVLWQTDQDFELLIVGDGCEDNTAEVIAAFSDARIRWFDLPKGPLSGYSNRNQVLRQAHGRFIAYGQDDDILLPDHIARLIGTLEETGEDWGYSRPLWVGRDGLVMPFAVDLTQRDQLDHFLNKFNTIPSSCVAHRRDALERVGYWPEDIPHISDWTCWQRMIKTSPTGRAAYCPTPTVLHFQARSKAKESKREEKIRAIAESGSWWPEACRIPIRANTSEQESAFREMVADPAAWSDRLRRGVTQVCDRLAWAWVLPVRTWFVKTPPPPPPKPPPPPPPPPAPAPSAEARALEKAERKIRRLKRASARTKRRGAALSPFSPPWIPIFRVTTRGHGRKRKRRVNPGNRR